VELREPGAVLLISCYELGHAPHALAMAAAFLERAGYRPSCVDLSIDALPEDAVRAAGLAVLSVPMHTALRIGVAAAARIHQLAPSCRLGFIGMYAPMNADYLRRLGADFVLGGELERDLVDAVSALERGVAPPAGVRLGKLDFPRPARVGLLPLSRYAHLVDGDGRHRAIGYAETSRGCLDSCRHCPVPAVYGGRFFVVPRSVVVDDLVAQIEAGAEHITFGDPDFLNGPGHSLAIARALHERWPEVTFDVTTQISHLCARPEVAGELAELGCAFVVSAVESLSDRVLEHLKKRHRRADVVRALELCRGAGLPMRPTFVSFTPWTTLDDVRELFDFIVDHDLIDHVDPIQLAVRLLVPPGSLLLADPASSDAFGELDPAALTHRWAHPDPRVDALQRRLAARVEAGVVVDEDPRVTFAALRDQVYAAASTQAPPLPVRPRPSIPRVTEPWFC